MMSGVQREEFEEFKEYLKAGFSSIERRLENIEKQVECLVAFKNRLKGSWIALAIIMTVAGLAIGIYEAFK
jgi:tetrahydromethanopterin S-methyltransferase subunit G